MAAKRKAARPKARGAVISDQPKTWVVLSAGAGTEVRAFSMDITDEGVLVFLGEDGTCTTAYARSAWTTVTLNPEPDQD